MRCARAAAPRPATSSLAPTSLLSPLQLIPLCIRHRLFSALLHIFASALQDHSTPAALLLVAAAAAGEAEAEAATAAAAAELAAAAAGGAWAAAQGSTAAAALQARESLRLAYKLLLFLRCCLLGLGYPPGGHSACSGAAGLGSGKRASWQGGGGTLATGLARWRASLNPPRLLCSVCARRRPCLQAPAACRLSSSSAARRRRWSSCYSARGSLVRWGG